MTISTVCFLQIILTRSRNTIPFFICSGISPFMTSKEYKSLGAKNEGMRLLRQDVPSFYSSILYFAIYIALGMLQDLLLLFFLYTSYNLHTPRRPWANVWPDSNDFT